MLIRTLISAIFQADIPNSAAEAKSVSAFALHSLAKSANVCINLRLNFIVSNGASAASIVAFLIAIDLILEPSSSLGNLYASITPSKALESLFANVMQLEIFFSDWLIILFATVCPSIHLSLFTVSRETITEREWP